eukprot:g36713.t1
MEEQICTDTQELQSDHVRELELELDELQIIQEAEGVRDVSDRADRILKGEGEQPEVMVHISTNDITRKRDEDLKSEYRELGWKQKGRTNRAVILGLQLVPRASEARNRERVQLNTCYRA